MRLPFVLRIPVRFRDIDGMGHLNNAVYFTYMEYGRQEYWFAMTGNRTIKAFDFIVGKAECTYKSPTLLGETVVLAMGVTHFGNASFTMEYEMTEETSGRLLAVGRTDLVSYNYDEKRVIRIPKETRTRMEAFEASLRNSPVGSVPGSSAAPTIERHFTVIKQERRASGGIDA